MLVPHHLFLYLPQDNYEEDIFASDAVTSVIKIMEKHNEDEEVMISALKFLGNIATAGKKIPYLVLTPQLQ